MRLHEHPELFESTLLAASNYFQIPDPFIEKDYWLTSVLKKLSESCYADLFVFKGGTSLSKAFGLIKRFSEDVDLALLDHQDLSGNQIKSRIKTVSKQITRHLKDLDIEDTTRKWSRFRRTAHRYPLLNEVPLTAQITSYLVLELNAFGNPHPYTKMPIRSFVHDFLFNQGHGEMIAEYGLSPFLIQVLQPERTLGEKVMALARASYHATPLVQLQNKIRHAYDLHILMTTPQIQAFMGSDNFFITLSQVKQDDADSREFKGEWNTYPLSQALIYKDLDEVWQALAKTYTGVFRPLVYGELPAIEEIRASMALLAERLRVYDLL